MVRLGHEKSRQCAGVRTAQRVGGCPGGRRPSASAGGGGPGRASQHRQPLGLHGAGAWNRRPQGQAGARPATQAYRPAGEDGAGLADQAADALRLSHRPVDEPAAGGLDRATLGHPLQQQLPGGVAAGARTHAAKARPTRQGARRGSHRARWRNEDWPRLQKKPARKVLTLC